MALTSTDISDASTSYTSADGFISSLTFQLTPQLLSVLQLQLQLISCAKNEHFKTSKSFYLQLSVFSSSLNLHVALNTKCKTRFCYCVWVTGFLLHVQAGWNVGCTQKLTQMSGQGQLPCNIARVSALQCYFLPGLYLELQGWNHPARVQQCLDINKNKGHLTP